MQPILLDTTLETAFRAPQLSDYPRMSLTGVGNLLPSQLRAEKRGTMRVFDFVSPYLTDELFPGDNLLFQWRAELVFFPIRRVSRIPKVLAKLGLRAPTRHHALAFGLEIRKAPVMGHVLFPHEPVSASPVGEFQIVYEVRENLPYVRHMAYARPLSRFDGHYWVVGVAE